MPIKVKDVLYDIDSSLVYLTSEREERIRFEEITEIRKLVAELLERFGDEELN